MLKQAEIKLAATCVIYWSVQLFDDRLKTGPPTSLMPDMEPTTPTVSNGEDDSKRTIVKELTLLLKVSYRERVLLAAIIPWFTARDHSWQPFSFALNILEKVYPASCR